MDREIRADAKLKNLPREVLDALWMLRNPDLADEDGKTHTYAEILVWLKREHGIDSSLGALSEFYSWLRLRRGMEQARLRGEQAQMELAKDPNATPEAVARVGQMVFTAEMVTDRNVKAFVELEKLRLQAIALEQKNQQLQQENRKIELLEAKAKRLEALEAKAKELKQGGGLSAETLEMLENQLKIL